jgi:hypothetical protein
LIDSANPAHAPAVDVTGSARPQGKGPDKGAYEVSVLVESPPLVESPVENPPLVESPVEDPPLVEPVVKSPKPDAPGTVNKKPKAKTLLETGRLERFNTSAIGTWARGLIVKSQKPIRQRRFWTDGISKTK